MNTADTDAKPGFWAFSLTLYDRPGVAEACLALQDGFGADVNLLLLGFWRARQGYAGWAAGEIDRAIAAVGPVNAALQPLRMARRALKALQADEPAAVALYAEAKALELKLEQVAQVWLVGGSRVSPAPRRKPPVPREAEMLAAVEHLAAYLEHVAPGNPAILPPGAKLLDAAFT
ncbi:TIGR02444 family protein [Ferrovibrio sp.]|uniref:TIGR02444 family protein n=1 Tax=Ferrovibrio sp. TaxID=1917215 RepID=UPI0026262C97|nr:TIGR02444 family protein [Ferrovibrio sp.]